MANQRVSPRLVVFDIAGAIIADHGEVVHAFRQVFGAHGIAVGEAELKEWKGASKREVIRHFLARQEGVGACGW